MIIIENKWIRILIIINLALIAFILIGKLALIHKLLITIGKAFLIPLFISALIFYIVRPLNNIFIKKGLGHGKSGLLTLTMFTFLLSGLLSYFGRYTYEEFNDISKELLSIINKKDYFNGYLNWINDYVNFNEIYTLITGMVKNYINQIGHSFMRFASYFMNAFSTVFLIIIIVFYLLKDGHKLKGKILLLTPKKYVRLMDEILSESDTILSHYVTGQAKVALALSIMIFTGYKIIGMPNAVLFSTITFILAFIPFIGFFISMIIPTVIALALGFNMFIRLVAVFIIVQTLKGRVVVPAIMAKSMKIHPLTDIFLVIGAIAVGGPFAAFAVVPVYAILKHVVVILKQSKET